MIDRANACDAVSDHLRADQNPDTEVVRLLLQFPLSGNGIYGIPRFSRSDLNESFYSNRFKPSLAPEPTSRGIFLAQKCASEPERKGR